MLDHYRDGTGTKINGFECVCSMDGSSCAHVVSSVTYVFLNNGNCAWAPPNQPPLPACQLASSANFAHCTVEESNNANHVRLTICIDWHFSGNTRTFETLPLTPNHYISLCHEDIISRHDSMVDHHVCDDLGTEPDDSNSPQ